jgi:NAD(P)-dependent dehydrogenase (short-subunit alcohol dehydrogenase family)
MSLAGKHMVVTGGGSGVGAEIARQFRSQGAAVTVLGRSKAPLEALAREIGALPLVADVTARDTLDAAIAAARAQNGPIDIAIANAGAAPSAPFDKVTAEAFADTVSVNLAGVFHLWQAVLADMKAKKWGRMIAVASTAGLKGYPYVASYCAAKHGVVGLTRGLAQELGPTGITVNALCPGFMQTPLLEKSFEKIMAKTGLSHEEVTNQFLSGNPQKRFVETEEVAATALWLCSDTAGSVNGHALSLSGGEV